MRFIESYVEEKRKELKQIENPTPLHLKLLDELKPSLTLFTFSDYINLLFTKFINNNEPTYEDEQLAYDIVSYLILNYIPKDITDVPYVKWSEQDVLSSPGKGLTPISLMYDDYRKWDKDRIELAKSIDKKKQIIVVNDLYWIWYNVMIEDRKLPNDFSPENFTYNDILLKVFLDYFISKISWFDTSTFIVYDKLPDSNFIRAKKLLDFIQSLLEDNSQIFTFSNLKDYLIPLQYENQFRLVVDINTEQIDTNLLNNVEIKLQKSLIEYEYKLNSPELPKDEMKNIKGIIATLKEQLSNIEKYKKDNSVTYGKLLTLLVSYKYGTYNYDNLLKFLIEENLVEEFRLVE